MGSPLPSDHRGPDEGTAMPSRLTRSAIRAAALAAKLGLAAGIAQGRTTYPPLEMLSRPATPYSASPLPTPRASRR